MKKFSILYCPAADCGHFMSQNEKKLSIKYFKKAIAFSKNFNIKK